MGKFLFKSSIIFFMGISGIIGFLYFVSKNYDVNSLSVVNDKHKLLETAPSPRIIFIGGSNIIYGLDSRMVENELNYACIDMSLNAGVGLQFMLNEVKYDIKAGDILVIMPEFDYFELPVTYATISELIRVVEDNFFYVKYLSSDQLMLLINLIPQLCQDRLQKVMNNPKISYNDLINYKKNFNKNGDIINHINEEPEFFPFRIDRDVIKNLNDKIPSYKLLTIRLLINREFTHNKLTEKLSRLGFCKDEIKIILKDSYSKRYFSGQINSEVISLLNKFNLYATGRGAKVYFSFPSYDISYYKANEEQILSFYTQLKKNLTFDIVNSPEHSTFSEEYVYDSEYHLTGEGRKIRTYKLINDLKKYIQFPEKPSDKFIKYIQFGSAGDAIDYEIGGWSDPKEGFTWTDGKIANLLLLPPKPVRSDIIMKTYLKPFLVPGKLEKQRVNIYVNNILIDKWIVTSSGFYKTVIPESCISNSAFLKITFELPDAVSPAETGINEDERVIAIAFKFITLSESQSYKFGTDIYFGKDGNSIIYQETGWSYPEEYITWTEGKKAELSLPIEPVTSDIIMKVNMEPLIINGIDKQRVIIYINNKKTGTWIAGSSGEYEITIPKDYIETSTLNITFELPDAVSPESMGIGEDKRVLGLKLSSIKLELSK